MGFTIHLCKNCFSSVFIFSYYNVRHILFTLFITPFMIWELQVASIGTVNTYVILGVLYLGVISTAGAFFLWNKGLELMDASIGSLFFFFQPIVRIITWLALIK
ncbi:EamA family transporter [Bacillus toyonensis]